MSLFTYENLKTGEKIKLKHVKNFQDIYIIFQAYLILKY